MTDELKMVHGEDLWQDKYNRLVDTVEQMGGVVDQLQWTNWSKEGLVFLNGFNDIGTKYRYANIGNVKLVELEIKVSLTSTPSNSAPTAVELPDSLHNEIEEEHAESNRFMWIVNAREFHVSPINSNSWWVGNDSHYMMHLLYTHTN